MINENDKKFNEAMQETQKVSLTPQEKAEIKANLVNFIKTYSPPHTIKPQPAWFSWQPNFLKKNLVLQYAALGLVISTLAGFGVCSAAQKALPGDALYPLKTNFNEKAAAMLKLSEESKIDYNVHLVNVRLEEVEKIASKDELDEKKSVAVKDLLDKHITKAKDQINEVKNKKQTGQNIEAAATLEVSLNGHAKVLEKLQEKHDGAELKNIIKNIKEKAKEIELDANINNL